MESELPTDALLAKYQPPHYTDCFSTTVSGEVSLGEFVTAFYTAPLFRAERFVLRLIGRASTDEHVQQLVSGTRETFAAWSVEERTSKQLLMCDFQSRTRSWFQVEPHASGTRVWFGSAVTADANADGPPSTYRVLLGLHRLYSRMLLRGAVRRLARSAS